LPGRRIASEAAQDVTDGERGDAGGGGHRYDFEQQPPRQHTSTSLASSSGTAAREVFYILRVSPPRCNDASVPPFTYATKWSRIAEEPCTSAATLVFSCGTRYFEDDGTSFHGEGALRYSGTQQRSWCEKRNSENRR
jgi:hypothetical protein